MKKIVAHVIYLMFLFTFISFKYIHLGPTKTVCDLQINYGYQSEKHPFDEGGRA